MIKSSIPFYRRPPCSWGLLFPQLCLIYKKLEVDIQRYFCKLNFVIFSCVLPKFWWIREKTPFCIFLLDFFWEVVRGEEHLWVGIRIQHCFSNLLLTETMKVAGIKRVQLRLCLICDKPYCENQTTWNFKAELEIGDREWSWDGKNTPGEWNGLKVTGEGGGTVINGEWQKKLQIITAKLESPKRIKTEARFLENTWSN